MEAVEEPAAVPEPVVPEPAVEVRAEEETGFCLGPAGVSMDCVSLMCLESMAYWRKFKPAGLTFGTIVSVFNRRSFAVHQLIDQLCACGFEVAENLTPRSPVNRGPQDLSNRRPFSP